MISITPDSSIVTVIHAYTVTSYSQWDAVASKKLFDDPAVLGPTLDAFKPCIGLATGQDFMMYDVLASRSFR
jgi:hypothetical protein